MNDPARRQAENPDYDSEESDEESDEAGRGHTRPEP